jgi:Tfp pilus assembly ATPase PilU
MRLDPDVIMVGEIRDAETANIATQAALTGNRGMQALINDNTAIYVVDESPQNELRYRARFYFDPNTISMAKNNAHTS